MQIEYIGPNHNRKKLAIINSHQSKYPVGNDLWIKQSEKVLLEYLNNNYIILSSIELNTYEILIYLTRKYNGFQDIVIPIFKNQNKDEIINNLIKEFNLDAKKTGFYLFFNNVNPKNHKLSWKIRDEIIFNIADLIIPISIRENGYIQELLNKTEKSKINYDYQIKYTKSLYKLLELPKLNSIKNFDKWNYLTHWTSTFFKPYPFENYFDFYDSIFKSENFYSHNAFNTLRHILKTKVLKATDSLIKGQFSCISFTENTPQESIKNMIWRSNRFRYTYEPYGIAFDKDYLISLGARKTMYLDRRDYDNLNPLDKPFFQYYGKDKRWISENEWRLTKDIYLDKIPSNKYLIIVKNNDEREYLSKEFPYYSIISIF